MHFTSRHGVHPATYLAATIVCATVPAAHAAPPGPACNLQTSDIGMVIALTGPQSFRAHDGEELYLAGILTPTAYDGATTPSNWPIATKARTALMRLVKGRSIGINRATNRPDRYRRRHVQAVVLAGQRRIWVQAALVDRGFARVDPETASPACATALLELERQARARRDGLWANAAYAVHRADRPYRLLRARSTFQLVEGRVHRVGRTGRAVYINFSRNWRKDFTVSVSMRIVQDVGRSGIDLMALAGKRIRVRGWIERRGGPLIRLTTPAQLESLSREKSMASRSETIEETSGTGNRHQARGHVITPRNAETSTSDRPLP